MSDSLETQWAAFREVQQEPDNRELVGDIWKAAEAAGIMPGTIRVWMSRGKVKPLFGERGHEVFHIPTVIAVAEAGRAKNIPRDPAANARGPHARRVALQAA
jgi:hypothetical protein